MLKITISADDGQRAVVDDQIQEERTRAPLDLVAVSDVTPSPPTDIAECAHDTDGFSGTKTMW